MNRKYRKSQQKRLLKQGKSLERIKTEAAVKEANRRIGIIQKRYKNGEGSWGITKLKNIIPEFFDKKGYIKTPKNASYMDLMNLYRESTRFTKSRTSTIKGIENIKEEAKSTLKETLSRSGKFEEVTEEDINDYYSMFEDDDVNSFIAELGITPSEFFAIIDDAIRYGDTQDEFIKRIETLRTIADENIRKKAIRIYNKYVR